MTRFIIIIIIKQFLQISGMCPILIGVEKSEISMIELCLKCPKTKLDVTAKNGNTPLILAAGKNDIDILEILLCHEFLERLKVEHQNVS